MSRVDFFSDMAPEQLIAYLGEPRENYNLTFAAEAAGLVDSEHWPAARAALLKLLKHESSLVREGVIYGLTGHLDDEVRVALENVRANDASPGVREAADEALTEDA